MKLWLKKLGRTKLQISIAGIISAWTSVYMGQVSSEIAIGATVLVALGYCFGQGKVDAALEEAKGIITAAKLSNK